MAIASIWTNIANWSTPIILFCLLNLMIAIIFIASNFGNNHHGNSPRMLDRVKSANLSSFFSITLSEQINSASELTDSEQVDITKELTRAPSFLDRVKSFRLTSPFKSDSPFNDTSTSQDDHFDVLPDHDVVEDHNDASDNSHYNLSNVWGKSSSTNLAKRSTSHLTKSSSEKRVVESASELTDSEQVNITKELTRAPSFLDRFKSFKLASPFKSDSPPGDTFTSQDEHFDVVEDHNDASDNSHYNNLSNAGMNLAKRSTSHLTKSSSEKRVVESDNNDEDIDRRRPATMREFAGVKDENVNVKADDFIKRFKQQLKLQRLDSLQRLKDMLNRGT